LSYGSCVEDHVLIGRRREVRLLPAESASSIASWQ
jgi:hypothetical protein